ncbi:hypothetical protein E4T56_gene20735 [Termitomyces sp. T112]|nr:hypothetical protein E4T56_gene20735 [Termitomyces sp. T112]
MSTNQKDKPSKRQNFIQGFRSMFKFPKSRNSSPARNALPNPSSSELGSMQTAPTSTPSLATGNEVPRTTVRDTSSLLPANKVPDTGDDTGTRITVEVPMDTAQPTVSLIHTSSTVMDPSVTPLISGSHTSLVHMTTFQPEALLTPMEADGGGNSSAAVSQVSHSSGTLMRDGLQLAWNGVQLLLEKAEKSLAGTPFQVPVGIINTLIELKNAVSDNNDELDSQIRRTQERLSIIKDVSDKNTGSDELMKDFAKKLADKLSDLDKMAKQATWKKILENEQNKSKIDGIFKYIDEQTKDFQMRLALKIDQNTEHLQQSLNQMQLDNWPFPKNLIPTRLKILHNILCAEEQISTSIAAGLLSDAADKDMKERADDLVKKLHAVLYVKDDKVFCGAQLQELNGHTESVKSVAFSPDGKSIVSGSDDQSVRVWDASSGAQLQELNGHTSWVTSVTFSPDGKSIVSGSYDQSVRVWDASSGAQLQELNGHTGSVTSVAFSPDGKSIVSGSDDRQDVKIAAIWLYELACLA